MHYLVYKITNKINGKFYIGVHKTECEFDGYMGSGKLIKQAISKYGIENFEKTILYRALNSEEMFKIESELVEISERSYNLKLGGEGGFEYINSNHELREQKNKKARKVTNERHCDKLLDWAKKGGRRRQEIHGTPEGLLNYRKPKGFVTSEETKEKLRKKAKLRVGSLNSSFGSIWITNGVESKKIKREDPIPDGWKRGRVLKSVGRLI